ncbi:MAG: ribonuclease H-like domain-containing protein [bacterium]
MPTLIFDIETIGENFDSMDETTQSVLTRWVDRDVSDKKEKKDKIQEIKNSTALSPLTGEIVAIGVLDSATKNGAVYYQSPETQANESQMQILVNQIALSDDKIDGNKKKEGVIKLKPMSEKEMLEQFWQLAIKYDAFVSFNGRSFDVPFMLLRSAIHKIIPSKDLMSNRYLNSQKFNAKHIDLFDQFSFYGSAGRKGNLHLFCRAFGIKSPKQGVCGSDVGNFFAKRKYKEIAEYNVGDIVATDELYQYWEKYLRF